MSIKELIKKFSENNPMIDVAIKLFMYRNNKETISSINQIFNDPNLIDYERIGANPTLAPICNICIGNSNEGFFAILRWIIDALYFCKRIGASPRILINSDSIYYDNNKKLNPFTYYFEDIECPSNCEGERGIIHYNGRNGLLAELLNNTEDFYEYSSEYVEQMSQVVREYLIFNNNTQQILTQYIEKNGICDSVLGVHIRGTDYKKHYKNHPIYIGPNDYYPVINKILLTEKYEKIYLATDDEEILQQMIKFYGEEKVIYSKSVHRVTGNVGSHFQNGSNGFEKGLEVVADMYALSLCGGIVSGLSQVSLFSRLFKKSRGEIYTTDIILNKGVHKDGPKFKR